MKTLGGARLPRVRVIGYRFHDWRFSGANTCRVSRAQCAKEIGFTVSTDNRLKRAKRAERISRSMRAFVGV
jgi:hypothetical protein